MFASCNDEAGHHVLWVVKSGEVNLSVIPKDLTPSAFQEKTTQMQIPFRVANKKQHMSLCMQKAVELHNGSIIKQSIIDKAKHFLVEYEIKTSNGVWLVTCDLDNGNITKEQQSN